MASVERKQLLLWFSRRDELTQQDIMAKAKDGARRFDNNLRKAGKDVNAGKTLLDAFLIQIKVAMASTDDNKISSRKHGDVLNIELNRAERIAREMKEDAKQKRRHPARIFLESHKRLILGMHERGISFRDIQKILIKKNKALIISSSVIHKIVNEWLNDANREKELLDTKSNPDNERK